MKIVYCINSISELGGTEIITIEKANALSKIKSNKIWICVTDFVKNQISERLCDTVNLINLNVNYYKNDRKSILHLLYAMTVKRLHHKAKLKKLLNEIHPDVVISVGQCEKYMIPEIKGNWVKVRELHYPTEYRIIKASSLVKRIIAYLIHFYDFKLKIKGYDKIVVLTYEDKQRNWAHNPKVTVIPNPIQFKCDKEKANLENKKVIFIGRLEAQKNLMSLIRVFSKVVLSHPDWSLEIYGYGSDYERLNELVLKLGLNKHVLFRGVTEDSYNVMAGASVFVLSSLFEGFPLALVEAMSCGVPVVCYDCPCGPKDIIDDGVDGFLVRYGDEDTFAQKLSSLIEDEDMRRRMGQAAVEKVKNYELDTIISMWMSLFENLIIRKTDRISKSVFKFESKIRDGIGQGY